MTNIAKSKQSGASVVCVDFDSKLQLIHGSSGNFVDDLFSTSGPLDEVIPIGSCLPPKVSGLRSRTSRITRGMIACHSAGILVDEAWGTEIHLSTIFLSVGCAAQLEFSGLGRQA